MENTMVAKKNVHTRHSKQIPLTKEQGDYFGSLGAPWSASQEGVTFALVGNRSSDFQVIENMPRDLLANHILSRHDCREEKDGPGVIWADIADLRTNASVRAVTALSYDVDGPIELDELRSRLQAFGHRAVLHTTSSHLKTISSVPASVFGAAKVITDEMLRQHLVDTRKTYLQNVVLLHDGKARLKKERLVFEFRHDPIAKCRVIVFISSPIEITLGIGIEGYRAVYRVVGDHLFGAGNYDGACANPARLNYLPSHQPAGAYATYLLDGPPLDWSPYWERVKPDVERREHERNRRAQMAETTTDLKVLAHTIKPIPAHDYFIWLRVIAGLHHATDGGEDGRALAHEWSATAGNYDERAVDRLWDGLDPDHPNPVTLGSLIFLARQFDPSWSPLESCRRQRRGGFWASL